MTLHSYNLHSWCNEIGVRQNSAVKNLKIFDDDVSRRWILCEFESIYHEPEQSMWRRKCFYTDVRAICVNANTLHVNAKAFSANARPFFACVRVSAFSWKRKAFYVNVKVFVHFTWTKRKTSSCEWRSIFYECERISRECNNIFDERESAQCERILRECRSLLTSLLFLCESQIFVSENLCECESVIRKHKDIWGRCEIVTWKWEHLTWTGMRFT